MVLGEGTVFASLLVLGLLRLEHNIRRERVRLARERNMLLGVTHELKTPLASVQLGVDTLKRLALSEEDRTAVLDNMQSGIQDLERRVEDMLTATRLQRHDALQASSFSWKEAIREAVDRMSSTSDGRLSWKEEADEAGGDWVRGDRGLWVLAAANLIENALKYSSGVVHVRAQFKEGQALLEVQDEGTGIAPEDRDAALSPFVRLHHEGAGTGLGLHLVAQTAELHHAQLTMTRLEPTGFLVRVFWAATR
jgi:two-component system, OmpR family, phosphate regulon sensor histidine kinase PhoR